MKLFIVVGVLTHKRKTATLASHSGIFTAHSEAEAIGMQMKWAAEKHPEYRVETISAYDISDKALAYAKKFGPASLQAHEIKP